MTQRASLIVPLACLLAPLAGCRGDGVPTAPTIQAPGVQVEWSAVSAGHGAPLGHTCGLTTEGVAYCWGANDSGMLGYDTTSSGSSRPLPVSGGLTFAAVDAGWKHSCGVTEDGAGYCWGNGRWPAYLGDGLVRGSDLPIRVAGQQRFRTIAAGSGYTCGLAQAGAAYCWGGGFSDADPMVPGAVTPTPVGDGVEFRSVSVAGWSACALTDAGLAHCWGGLGDGSEDPVEVPGGLAFEHLSVGEGYGSQGQHACGLTSAGRAYCWGYMPTTGVVDSPLEVPADVDFAAVESGGGFACGLEREGAAYCWGDNSFGQLGDGSTQDRETPVPVAGGLGFESISAGSDHVCGVTPEGEAYCWGHNVDGELGNGEPTSSGDPGVPFLVRVADPIR